MRPEKQQRALELAAVNQQRFPQSPITLATLGWIQFRLGQIPQAEAAFQQLTATQNLDPASAFFVSVYLQKNKDYDSAIGLLKAALENRNYFMYRKSAEQLLQELENQHNENVDQRPNDKRDGVKD